MALYKEITKSNGVTTSYHKVTVVTVSQDSSYYMDSSESQNQNEKVQLSVKLTSYLNQEYRDNNQPIDSQIYYFTITNEEEESTSARKLAYNQLKTLPMWADAEDC